MIMVDLDAVGQKIVANSKPKTAETTKIEISFFLFVLTFFLKDRVS